MSVIVRPAEIKKAYTMFRVTRVIATLMLLSLYSSKELKNLSLS